jgi:hypothetical protein
MSQRAIDITNALLRLGVLDPIDPNQGALREELFGDAALWDDVAERLDAVGYQLVQMLGHLGVRLSRSVAVAPLITASNSLRLDARHARVLVYLWVHLVYRQLKQMRRDEPAQTRGAKQTLFDLDEPDDLDHAPTLLLSDFHAEFGELYAKTTLKAALTVLKRGRFVREAKGELSAGPALYVLIDHERMEEFVVGLARRGALDLPLELSPERAGHTP